MTPDKEVLTQLYTVEKKSLGDIGLIYGVHRQQIRRWLLRADVPVRTISEGTSLATKGRPHSAKNRAATLENLKKARAGRTKESNRKQSATMKAKYKDQVHPKTGRKWTPIEIAAHTYRQTPEYRHKQSLAVPRGENHYAWVGGTKDEFDLRLSTYQWRLRRQECYERDSWTCQECGAKCLSARAAKQQGRHHLRIQAHHIVPRRKGGSDELENLVTLCLADHRRIEHLNK